jgi:hypothetical protein
MHWLSHELRQSCHLLYSAADTSSLSHRSTPSQPASMSKMPSLRRRTSYGWIVYEYAAPVAVPGFDSFYGVDALTNIF